MVCRICSAQNFINASVENWGISGTCDINIPPDSWTNYSNGGIGPEEVNLSICPTTLPALASNGNTYARMYSGTNLTGEGMFQDISGFNLGNNYQITFDYSGTNYIGPYVGQIQFHLFIDDVDVNQTPIFQSTDTTWNPQAFNFTAIKTKHKIGVRLYTLSGIGNGAIDNFNLSTTITTKIENDIFQSIISVFPNPNNGNFTVESTIEGEYFLINSLGQEMQTFNLSAQNNFTVQVDGLNAGMYFLKSKNTTLDIRQTIIINF